MCRNGDIAQAKAILNSISVETTGKAADFQVIVSDEITLPMLTGIRRPTFLLPNTRFSDEDMRYILRHEWYHYSESRYLDKALYVCFQRCILVDFSGLCF